MSPDSARRPFNRWPLALLSPQPLQPFASRHHRTRRMSGKDSGEHSGNVSGDRVRRQCHILPMSHFATIERAAPVSDSGKQNAAPHIGTRRNLSGKPWRHLAAPDSTKPPRPCV